MESITDSVMTIRNKGVKLLKQTLAQDSVTVVYSKDLKLYLIQTPPETLSIPFLEKT